ncbi:MAG TPA: hypothetical protein VG407_17730 [Caulobacteraceae bacterium]|jgi:uncharacterized protein YecT (DUF1311 family)|nr:hypothetical protein [Caulobacteraceae bacterium]
MHIRLFASCVILGLAVATAASAASFDCAKAKSRSEVLICHTPALSDLDSRMMQTYRADLAVSPTPVNLTLAQRQWIADRDKGEPADNQAKTFRPLTADEMAHDYTDRIDALKGEIDFAAKARATTFPIADLGKRCVPLNEDLAKKCVVSSSGQVKGAASLWFQLQGPPEGDTDDFTRGVVVFEAGGPGQLRPRLWNFIEGGYYDDPRQLQTAAGALLWLPANDSGTGVFNEDLLYHQVDGRWRDIDLQSWKADLAQRLPKDRQVWKGVPYDFKALETTTGLWRPDDGNCCPTGGQAHVRFKLAGDRLEIVSVERSAKNLE